MVIISNVQYIFLIFYEVIFGKEIAYTNFAELLSNCIYDEKIYISFLFVISGWIIIWTIKKWL